MQLVKLYAPVSNTGHPRRAAPETVGAVRVGGLDAKQSR